MTTSKPKTSTILSITIFSIPMLIMGIYGFNFILSNAAWYHYAMAIVGTPLGFGLLLRQLVSYKTITVGKKKLSIKYFLKSKPKVFDINQIEAWKEDVVKTGTGTYKEISVQVDGRSILQLSKQEYNNYDQVVNYMRKNCGKKLVK